MARGPLPDATARRRNPPTIPTTSLPAGGRKGRPPSPPTGVELRKAGKAWWRWAWTTPQAASWDTGSRYTVARRAELEDDLAILDRFDPDDLASILGMPEDEAVEQLSFIIGRLKAMAGGRLAILREMRELDKTLGLNPKALADLRWKIIDETEAQRAAPVGATASSPRRSAKRKPAAVRRLRAVDPVAAAG